MVPSVQVSFQKAIAVSEPFWISLIRMGRTVSSWRLIYAMRVSENKEIKAHYNDLKQKNVSAPLVTGVWLSIGQCTAGVMIMTSLLIVCLES